jgi:hypothetical protein
MPSVNCKWPRVPENEFCYVAGPELAEKYEKSYAEEQMRAKHSSGSSRGKGRGRRKKGEKKSARKEAGKSEL